MTWKESSQITSWLSYQRVRNICYLHTIGCLYFCGFKLFSPSFMFGRELTRQTFTFVTSRVFVPLEKRLSQVSLLDSYIAILVMQCPVHYGKNLHDLGTRGDKRNASRASRSEKQLCARNTEPSKNYNCRIERKDVWVYVLIALISSILSYTYINIWTKFSKCQIN